VVAAEGLAVVVIGDGSQRTSTVIGCHAEIATNQRRVAPRSSESVVMTVAGRSRSPRGVPLPIRFVAMRTAAREEGRPRATWRTLSSLTDVSGPRAHKPNSCAFANRSMNKRSDSSSPFEGAKSLSRISCGRRGPMGNLAHARIMDSIRLFGERVISVS
jgi:hypothetical protein